MNELPQTTTDLLQPYIDRLRELGVTCPISLTASTGGDWSGFFDFMGPDQYQISRVETWAEYEAAAVAYVARIQARRRNDAAARDAMLEAMS